MRIQLPHPMTLGQIAINSQSTLALEENGCRLQAVQYFTTDSREVEKGDVFICLTGIQRDGHKFIEEACQKGAGAIWACKYTSIPYPVCVLYSEDVLAGFIRLAKWYLHKVNPQVIAVTGSTGKTTTRHMIASILREQYRVHESPQNYNNPLGCAITLLTMPPSTEYLVAECGMDGLGQIKALSHLLTPHIAVITNIGSAHMEKLGSKEAILQAKLEITHGMHGGPLFYPGDDTNLRQSVSHTAKAVFADSLSPYPKISNISLKGDSTSFVYMAESTSSPISLTIPAPGMHIALNGMLAVAVAFEVGISPHDIKAGLARYQPIQSRQTIYRFSDITVIDDTYNASLEAMVNAAKTLEIVTKEEQKSTCIAILGDMLELGDMAAAAHFRIGEIFAPLCTHLVFVGDMANRYAEGAIGQRIPSLHIRTFQKTETEEATHYIRSLPFGKTVLLLKGSHATPIHTIAQTLLRSFQISP